MSVPFTIPKDKFALWGSMACLKDGTVVALTSTNAFSKGSQIWMIKGSMAWTLTAPPPDTQPWKRRLYNNY